MKLLMKESGKDANGKFRANNNWVGISTWHKALSVQMKTGKKGMPAREFESRIKLFHWHSV